MRALFLAPYPLATTPSQRFRFEQYFQVLEKEGIDYDFGSFYSKRCFDMLYMPRRVLRKGFFLAADCARRAARVITSDSYDVVVIHRELCPVGPPWLEAYLRRLGQRIIFDFDDAIYLPDTSSYNPWVALIKNSRKTKKIIELSDHVIAGNSYLASYARQFNPNVTVIPTTIDTDLYKRIPSPPRPNVCIGWSGSRTTIKHFSLAVPVLKTLSKSYPIDIKVIGSSRVQPEGLKIEAQDWRLETEQEDLRKLDVGIMPLPDEEWAKGKCGLKALQYMALGIPTVCSPVGVNTEIIEDGVNGFLASSEEEWVEKLSRLIVDPELRLTMGQRARATVEKRYSLRSQANPFVNLLKAVGRGI